ncbi:MAG TPA: hypothetical protein DEA55_08470 [Rhodospirillaceae bacterium]|nr:hypothetical protein [Rhodospirillaceae bacterium]
MASIQKIFETLGFSDEEVKTYLLLLELGPISGGEMSKKMGLPRPTVYGYLEKLVSGGLASTATRRSAKIFVPAPTETLRLLYKRKIEDLRSLERSLDDVLPQMEKRMGMKLMRPRIQFYEGRDGMEAAIQDNLNYPNSKRLAFWSVKAAIGATSEEFFWYHNKERIRRNIQVEAIWPSNQTVDTRRYPFMGIGPAFKREGRIAPKGMEASMGFWIYANKVLFASSRAESFCFIIESQELVETMTRLHKMVWENSTPVATKPSDAKAFLDDLYAED